MVAGAGHRHCYENPQESRPRFLTRERPVDNNVQDNQVGILGLQIAFLRCSDVPLAHCTALSCHSCLYLKLKQSSEGCTCHWDFSSGIPSQHVRFADTSAKGCKTRGRIAGSPTLALGKPETWGSARTQAPGAGQLAPPKRVLFTCVARN